jgi:N-acetyltransferase
MIDSKNHPFQPVRDARPDDAPWPTMIWPPPNVPLEGEYVELAPCIPDRDAEGLFAALQNDAVWQHMPVERPRDPAQLAAALSARLDAGRFVWTVRLLRSYRGLEAGAIVGTSSYLEVSVPDARLEIGATAYSPAVWATKVNPDAKFLLLRCAFDTLKAGRVQLKTDARNVRSQRAIARLGARHEATLRRFQRRVDGTVRDTVLFSIVAEDWPAVGQGLFARLREPEG